MLDYLFYVRRIIGGKRGVVEFFKRVYELMDGNYWLRIFDEMYKTGKLREISSHEISERFGIRD